MTPTISTSLSSIGLVPFNVLGIEMIDIDFGGSDNNDADDVSRDMFPLPVDETDDCGEDNFLPLTGFCLDLLAAESFEGDDGTFLPLVS